jgi:hypothetical protein
MRKFCLIRLLRNTEPQPATVAIPYFLSISASKRRRALFFSARFDVFKEILGARRLFFGAFRILRVGGKVEKKGKSGVKDATRQKKSAVSLRNLTAREEATLKNAASDKKRKRRFERR